MFYRQQRYYHTHSLLYILSLIAAFILGRKSQEYGYTIISRGGGSSISQNDNEMGKEKDTDFGNDKLNEHTMGGSYTN